MPGAVVTMSGGGMPSMASMTSMANIPNMPSGLSPQPIKFPPALMTTGAPIFDALAPVQQGKPLTTKLKGGAQVSSPGLYHNVSAGTPSKKTNGATGIPGGAGAAGKVAPY
jgi:hypothetical protein